MFQSNKHEDESISELKRNQKLFRFHSPSGPRLVNGSQPTVSGARKKKYTAQGFCSSTKAIAVMHNEHCFVYDPTRPPTTFSNAYGTCATMVGSRDLQSRVAWIPDDQTWNKISANIGKTAKTNATLWIGLSTQIPNTDTKWWWMVSATVQGPQLQLPSSVTLSINYNNYMCMRMALKSDVWVDADCGDSMGVLCEVIDGAPTSLMSSTTTSSTTTSSTTTSSTTTSTTSSSTTSTSAPVTSSTSVATTAANLGTTSTATTAAIATSTTVAVPTTTASTTSAPAAATTSWASTSVAIKTTNADTSPVSTTPIGTTTTVTPSATTIAASATSIPLTIAAQTSSAFTTTASPVTSVATTSALTTSTSTVIVTSSTLSSTRRTSPTVTAIPGSTTSPTTTTRTSSQTVSWTTTAARSSTTIVPAGTTINPVQTTTTVSSAARTTVTTNSAISSSTTNVVASSSTAPLTTSIAPTTPEVWTSSAGSSSPGVTKTTAIPSTSYAATVFQTNPSTVAVSTVDTPAITVVTSSVATAPLASSATTPVPAVSTAGLTTPVVLSSTAQATVMPSASSSSSTPNVPATTSAMSPTSTTSITSQAPPAVTTSGAESSSAGLTQTMAMSTTDFISTGTGTSPSRAASTTVAAPASSIPTSAAAITPTVASTVTPVPTVGSPIMTTPTSDPTLSVVTPSPPPTSLVTSSIAATVTALSTAAVLTTSDLSTTSLSTASSVPTAVTTTVLPRSTGASTASATAVVTDTATVASTSPYATPSPSPSSTTVPIPSHPSYGTHGPTTTVPIPLSSFLETASPDGTTTGAKPATPVQTTAEATGPEVMVHGITADPGVTTVASPTVPSTASAATSNEPYSASIGPPSQLLTTVSVAGSISAEATSYITPTVSQSQSQLQSSVSSYATVIISSAAPPTTTTATPTAPPGTMLSGSWSTGVIADTSQLTDLPPSGTAMPITAVVTTVSKDSPPTEPSAVRTVTLPNTNTVIQTTSVPHSSLESRTESPATSPTVDAARTTTPTTLVPAAPSGPVSTISEGTSGTEITQKSSTASPSTSPADLTTGTEAVRTDATAATVTRTQTQLPSGRFTTLSSIISYASTVMASASSQHHSASTDVTQIPEGSTLLSPAEPSSSRLTLPEARSSPFPNVSTTVTQFESGPAASLLFASTDPQAADTKRVPARTTTEAPAETDTVGTEGQSPELPAALVQIATQDELYDETDTTTPALFIASGQTTPDTDGDGGTKGLSPTTSTSTILINTGPLAVVEAGTKTPEPSTITALIDDAGNGNKTVPPTVTLPDEDGATFPLLGSSPRDADMDGDELATATSGANLATVGTQTSLEPAKAITDASLTAAPVKTTEADNNGVTKKPSTTSGAIDADGAVTNSHNDSSVGSPATILDSAGGTRDLKPSPTTVSAADPSESRPSSFSFPAQDSTYWTDSPPASTMDDDSGLASRNPHVTPMASSGSPSAIAPTASAEPVKIAVTDASAQPADEPSDSGKVTKSKDTPATDDSDGASKERHQDLKTPPGPRQESASPSEVGTLATIPASTGFDQANSQGYFKQNATVPHQSEVATASPIDHANTNTNSGSQQSASPPQNPTGLTQQIGAIPTQGPLESVSPAEVASPDTIGSASPISTNAPVSPAKFTAPKMSDEATENPTGSSNKQPLSKPTPLKPETAFEGTHYHPTPFSGPITNGPRGTEAAFEQTPAYHPHETAGPMNSAALTPAAVVTSLPEAVEAEKELLAELARADNATPADSGTTTVSVPEPEDSPMSDVEKLVAKIFRVLGCTYIVAILASVIIVFQLLLRDYTFERMIHLSQEAALLLAHIDLLCFGDRLGAGTSTQICRVSAIACQFLFTTVCAFQAIEALQIHAIYTNSVGSNGAFVGSRLYAFAAGFGIPAVVTVGSLGALRGPDVYLGKYTCWLNMETDAIKAVIIPIGSFVFLSAILLEAASLSMTKRYPSTSLHQWNTAMINHGGLVVLLVTNTAGMIIGMMTMHFQKIAWSTLTLAMNVTNACFIFFFHAFSDYRFRCLLRRAVSCMAKNSKKVLRR